MSNSPRLLSPLQVGELHLAHRIVMAPLTRMRSTQPGDIPNALNAKYYEQRASKGGLLISEATQISRQGKGYPGAPGIHSTEQVEGWRLVTDRTRATSPTLANRKRAPPTENHPSAIRGVVAVN